MTEDMQASVLDMWYGTRRRKERRYDWRRHLPARGFAIPRFAIEIGELEHRYQAWKAPDHA